MKLLSILVFAGLVAAPLAAFAHFPFIHIEQVGNRSELHSYFGHGVEPTDEKYFPRLEGATIWRLVAANEPQPLAFSRGKESLVARISSEGPAAFGFVKDQGVVLRNGTYQLTNYAKTHSDPTAWSIDTSSRLKLDITPQRRGDELLLTIRWEGKPLAAADVAVDFGDKTWEGKTDTKGEFTVPITGPGLYTARAWRNLQTPGERNGQRYDFDRHYSTLTIDVK